MSTILIRGGGLSSMSVIYGIRNGVFSASMSGYQSRLNNSNTCKSKVLINSTNGFTPLAKENTFSAFSDWNKLEVRVHSTNLM